MLKLCAHLFPVDYRILGLQLLDADRAEGYLRLVERLRSGELFAFAMAVSLAASAIHRSLFIPRNEKRWHVATHCFSAASPWEPAHSLLHRRYTSFS